MPGNTPEYFTSDLYQDFKYKVQRGAIPGYTYLQRHAYCTEASATYFGTLWSAGTPSLYQYPLSALTMNLSSTSANDHVIGTGARTVQINGLDINYNPISETLSLNGLTAVTTVNQYFRINDISCITFGQNQTNEGSIYIGIGSVLVNGTNTAPQSFIRKSAIYSEVGVYTIPAGYTLLVYDNQISVKNPRQAVIRTRVRANPLLPWEQVSSANIVGGARTEELQVRNAIATSGSDIELQCVGDAAATQVSAEFQLTLIDNSYL